MRIKNKIQKLGSFWLPSNENNKLPGLLSIEDGGNISIAFLGLLEEEREQWSVDIILGDIESEGKVTLVNCYYPKSKNYGHGIQYKNIIKAEYAFLGAYFFTKDELKFNELTFKVEGLNSWSGISGINIDHADNILHPTISYTKPEKVEIDIDSDFKLSLEFYINQTMAFHALGANDHAEIHQDTYWRIHSDENREFINSFDIAKKITNLMIFAIDKPICIEKISVQNSNIHEICLNEKEMDIPKSIQVFTSQTLCNDVIDEIHWNDMLFRYRDIENISTLIPRWLEMYSVIDPSLDLYFSVKFSKNKYEKSQFLILIQAIEAFYNRLNPKEEKNTLKSKLKDLFEVFAIVWDEKELEPYIEKITVTRNYLTHFNKKKEIRCIQEDEYPSYINTLELLLQFHFLAELGFKNEKIYKILKIDELKVS